MPEWVKCLFLSGAGVVLGGFITYLVSRAFYVKAANELNKATADLKQQSSILARLLEGKAKPIYNDRGELAGFSILLEGVQANTAVGGVVPVVEGDKKPD